jgi:predicted DNA-binding protein (UPF0251 family)
MVTGHSIAYVSGTGHIPLPKHGDQLHTSHRPWCVDCKRKHDADQLDDAGHCERCARAAVTRAAAAEQRAAAEAQAKADRKATATTPRLPKEGKQGQPTTRRSAPRATPASSNSGRAPDAGPSTHREKNPPAAQETRPAAACGPVYSPEADLDAQIQHVTRLLRTTADHTNLLVRTLRTNAVAALEALHLVHELTQTPAAATSTPVATGTRPAAGTRGGEAPRQPATRTSTDPRKIQLPVDDVAAAYQAGQTLGQIAETYGVSAPTVRRCLVEHNIPRRRSPVEYTPELVAEVRRLYDEQYLTQKEIGKRLGHSAKVIQRLMEVAGVNRRAAQARHGADNARGLKDQMAALGITSAHVRAWAHDQGMTNVPIRGLPSQQLIDAYTAAHPTAEGGDTAA